MLVKINKNENKIESMDLNESVQWGIMRYSTQKLYKNNFHSEKAVKRSVALGASATSMEYLSGFRILGSAHDTSSTALWHRPTISSLWILLNSSIVSALNCSDIFYWLILTVQPLVNKFHGCQESLYWQPLSLHLLDNYFEQQINQQPEKFHFRSWIS